jgi:two-component system cell cycle sensor histidine kinase/response regulator CckA
MPDPDDPQAPDRRPPNNPYIERLFEITPDMLCVAGMDGFFKIINPAFERNLGYTLGELKETPFLDFVHPDDRASTLKEMEKLKDGEVTLFFENRYLCKDGAYKWLAWTSHPDLKEGLLYAVAREVTARKREIVSLKGARAKLEDQRNELMGIVGDTEDELKRKEEQLRQAQKMESIGRLAGGIAHDINNMLMAILGFSDLAMNQTDLSEQTRECLTEIHKAGKRSATLARQLLAFGRKQVLEPKHVNLNLVLSDLDQMLHRVIREDIEINHRFDEHLGVAFVDPAQIEQVVLNLAINASDAMPDGGHLVIATSNADLDSTFVTTHPEMEAGSYVLLTVSDSGIGMDEATLSQIFEPFFTTKPVGLGTGLGLAMVYGVVKQSGGFIWADSEPGAGASFKIYFPRVANKTPDLTVASPTLASSRGGDETILLVEDEQVVLDLTATVLRNAGYTVWTALTPDKALESIGDSAQSIQLIISDVIMPGMSASTLVSKLIALNPEIKVIFMSGYADDAVVKNGFIQSGSVFLQKPFSPETLNKTVRQVLDDNR